MMEVRDAGYISRMLIEESNHHGGMLAELLEGAASEIDLLRDEKADLLSRAEKAEAERDAAYQKGQEDMRERAVEAAVDTWDWDDAIKAIRALPIKEAALSAKEGK
jgi:hypothetical protein